MRATRTVEGLNLEKWKERFGTDLAESGGLKCLVDAGLTEIKDGWLRLTTRGMEVQDAVVLELLEIQEAMEK